MTFRFTRRRFLGSALGSTLAVALGACRGGDGRSSVEPGPPGTSGPTAGVTGSTSSATPPATLAAVAPVEAPPAPALATSPFTLGVASGDPDPSSVVLWTRLAPDPLAEDAGMDAADQDLAWDVGADADFAVVVASGVVSARAEDGHSVHVVASALLAGTPYWYRFRVDQWTSPVGRTRTAPALDDAAPRLRLAAAACQHWEHGTYAAHRHLAAERPDLVLFLGDFIYEGAATTGGVRAHDGPEPVDLAGYRRRYALYRTDPDLQAAQAAAPWAVVWDDHEVENNYAGPVPAGGVSGDGSAAAFAERRAAAYRAWWENQPVRLPAPDGDLLPIHRELRWGSLAQLLLLDGRQYRSPQPCDGTVGVTCPERDEPAAQMLGAEQEAWLAERLAAGTAEGVTWTLLGNQTALTDMTVTLASRTYALFDQWDGYPAARSRLLDSIRATGVRNLVALTGDLHTALVGDLTRSPGGDVVGAEFIVTSISSRFAPGLEADFELAMSLASTVRQADTAHRGYLVADVGAGALEAVFRQVDATTTAPAPVQSGTRWVVRAGTPGAQPA